MTKEINWQRDIYDNNEYLPGDRVEVTEDHESYWYGIVEKVYPRYYLIRSQYNYTVTILKNDLSTGLIFMRKDKR